MSIIGTLEKNIDKKLPLINLDTSNYYKAVDKFNKKKEFNELIKKNNTDMYETRSYLGTGVDNYIKDRKLYSLLNSKDYARERLLFKKKFEIEVAKHIKELVSTLIKHIDTLSLSKDMIESIKNVAVNDLTGMYDKIIDYLYPLDIGAFGLSSIVEKQNTNIQRGQELIKHSE